MRVAEKNIEPGERIKGFLKVGETPSHDVRIPYIIIRGKELGPTLCVLGGVHALEYASIEGVLQVAKEIKPEELKGTLIIIPVVNTEGFDDRAAFINPIDYVNQNRVFPGDSEGSVSRRVAAGLFKNFVSKSNALIDSHGGDLTEDINKFVIIAKTDDKNIYQKMVDMASCYDAHYIRETDIVGSTKEALDIYGIPCITPESGTPYPVRKDEVDFHYNGIMNVMKYMKMIKGKAVTKNHPINPVQTKITSEHGGLWYQLVEAGRKVKKGDILGRVCNLFGDELQTIKAPYDGLVNNSRTSASVNSGDTLLYVIKIK